MNEKNSEGVKRSKKKSEDLLSIDVNTKGNREGIIAILEAQIETLKSQEHDSHFKLIIKLRELPDK